MRSPGGLLSVFEFLQVILKYLPLFLFREIGIERLDGDLVFGYELLFNSGICGDTVSTWTSTCVVLNRGYNAVEARSRLIML